MSLLSVEHLFVTYVEHEVSEVCGPLSNCTLSSMPMGATWHSYCTLPPARWVTLWRWLFSVCRMYEYVRGGFVEKELPAGAGGENSQLYEAFDSALRASSYNMWVQKSRHF